MTIAQKTGSDPVIEPDPVFVPTERKRTVTSPGIDGSEV